MNKRCALRLTGSGGQGVILISVILAEAAVLNGDKVRDTISWPSGRPAAICTEGCRMHGEPGI